MNLLPYRQRMIDAIIQSHIAKAVLMYPNAKENMTQVMTEMETYRPYAAADVDAIIEALK